ncbi:MAG: RNA polymerase sigma factor [Patescibacteria group bacterium]
MKSDDVTKFEQVYQGESDAIFRFCLVRVSNREQALDITQETFLRMWQTMLDGKEIFNDRAFLFTVARRLIIDWYRKKKSFSLEGMMSQDEKTEYDPPDPKTEDLIDVGAEARYLLEKIADLSEGYREAVYLHHVEDLSPGEIGGILGISANAASVRVNRGMAELRKIYGCTSEGDEFLSHK